jgi:hypothetical protein
MSVEDQHAPHVTIQLPVFNERYVVARILDSVAALDWPRGRLSLHVIDDSDDDTTSIVADKLAEARALGIRTLHLRRGQQRGYKAGALMHALPHADGQFIAIFDADFQPPPDFLRVCMAEMLADRGLGFVQARWTHLNSESCLLTRAQAAAIDGHFAVDQAARSASRLLATFNGSAGVWRRVCIVDAGGWHADTLTEDLDLALRAQMRGWRGLYLPHAEAAGELAQQLGAFANQQARWATGSIQTARKLWKRLCLAPSPRPASARIYAVLGTTTYLVHPLMLVATLSVVPMMILDSPGWPHAPWLLMGGLGPPLLYGLAQTRLCRSWRLRLARLAALAIIGPGLSLGLTRAVWRGLTLSGGVFERTPKFGVAPPPARMHGPYRIAPRVPVGEALMAIWCSIGLVTALVAGYAWLVPFMAMCSAGYSSVLLLTLGDGRLSRDSARPELAAWLRIRARPHAARPGAWLAASSEPSDRVAVMPMDPLGTGPGGVLLDPEA